MIPLYVSILVVVILLFVYVIIIPRSKERKISKFISKYDGNVCAFVKAENSLYDYKVIYEGATLTVKFIFLKRKSVLKISDTNEITLKYGKKRNGEYKHIKLLADITKFLQSSLLGKTIVIYPSLKDIEIYPNDMNTKIDIKKTKERYGFDIVGFDENFIK